MARKTLAERVMSAGVPLSMRLAVALNDLEENSPRGTLELIKDDGDVAIGIPGAAMAGFESFKLYLPLIEMAYRATTIGDKHWYFIRVE